jgi:DNA-binding NarL/FixJ family response regulator
VITVLIVDDQAMVREGFAALLSAQSDIVVLGDAANGADGVAAVRRLDPDVVLMDVRMPVMDGLAATEKILAGSGGSTGSPGSLGSTGSPRLTAPGGSGRPKVLILTTFDLDDYVFGALRAGASGFILKDAPAADLVHAVRVVAAGDALLAPSVTRRLIADYATRGRPDRRTTAALGELTPRETDVLRLIAHGQSNQEIAGKLVLAEQTVKTHVSRVLAKLALRDRAQAVVFAYESGLVTPGE